MTRGEPRLDVTLPDDLTVFTLLAALPNLPHFTLDARNEEGSGPSTRKPYYSARRSEEGRYLSGLLDLFGGLHQADDTLSTRYWRQMFDRLSGRTAATDAVFLEKVGNTLRQHLRANRAQFYTNDKAMTWLTNDVLKVARSLPASSRDLDFRVFETQAQQETADVNARRTGQEPWVYA